jgi:hypothetical protein
MDFGIRNRSASVFDTGRYIPNTEIHKIYQGDVKETFLQNGKQVFWLRKFYFMFLEDLHLVTFSI